MKKRLTTVILSAAIFSVLLSGCGSSSSSMKMNEPMEEAAYSYDYAAEEEYAYEEDYDYDSGMITEAKASVNGEVQDNDSIAKSNRKLIKTVNMTVETRDFDAMIANIQAKIAELGGYAQTMDVNGNSDVTVRRDAYIVARIPAGKLDGFVESVEKNSNILNKNESTEDVTLNYADTKAHKESLQIEQKRLNELLEQADSVETIIALESRLSEVRYEIESYESRLRTMDNQVEYSTVYLNVNEVKEYKPEPIEDPTFLERIGEGFTSGIETSLEIIQDFVVGIAGALPVLIVLAIILAIIAFIIFIIVKIIIAIVKKNQAKKAAKIAANYAKRQQAEAAKQQNKEDKENKENKEE